MPMGDPAGYLPSVKKARRRRGAPEYEPKAKYMPRSMRKRMPKSSPRPQIDPGTGGTIAPSPQPRKFPAFGPVQGASPYRSRKHENDKLARLRRSMAGQGRRIY